MCIFFFCILYKEIQLYLPLPALCALVHTSLCIARGSDSAPHMPYCHYDKQIKEVALKMWELPEKYNEADIKQLLDVSQASLHCWHSNWGNHDSVDKPTILQGPCGCPNIILGAILSEIREIYKDNADTYLAKIQWWLGINHDIVISMGALCDMLNAAGLTCKKLHVIAKEQDQDLITEF
jgi:hypothetical protein